MEPTYFITAAALVLIFVAVRLSDFVAVNPFVKTGLFVISFWGGVEALVAWGFLHSPL
tara:strand:- start:667 stop:840 length:174 start_codon:yes stop_codon:yes gene_type:complete